MDELDRPSDKYDVIVLDPDWQYANRIGGAGRTKFGAGVHDKYPTRHAADIAKLDIDSIAADNCVMFMWITCPVMYDTVARNRREKALQQAKDLLDSSINTHDVIGLMKARNLLHSLEVDKTYQPHDALHLLEKWGFKYATVGFTWIKLTQDGSRPVYGTGAYTASNTELCIIATRGTGMTPKAWDGRRMTPSVIHSPRREHSRKPDELFASIDEMYPNAKKIELFARRPREGWHVWGNEVDCDVEINHL